MRMSSGEIRRVSHQDIQWVQNLIECCLQLCMNQKEVVDTLFVQAKIEPDFTELVWQNLEEENCEFFEAYHVRLILKNQIIAFNKLLERQVDFMQKLCPSGVASAPLSNGSSSVHQGTSGYGTVNASTSTRPENMLSNGDPSSTIINGGSSGHQVIQFGSNALVHPGRMDVLPNMLSTQSSNMGLLHGMNGTTIKPEPNCSDNSEFAFCADGTLLESRTSIDDVSGASFSSSDLTGTPFNEPLLDVENSSFGFPSPIPCNFSLSDLTDDFTICADILENYGRSLFLASGPTNSSESPGRECKGENKHLDTISEGIIYEDFRSD